MPKTVRNRKVEQITLNGNMPVGEIFGICLDLLADGSGRVSTEDASLINRLIAAMNAASKKAAGKRGTPPTLHCCAAAAMISMGLFSIVEQMKRDETICESGTAAGGSETSCFAPYVSTMVH